jgi:small GTP-binding protein
MSCCTPVTVELPLAPRTPGKIHTVALVGPPNSGKSTLFNRLTGLRQKVANYPGVTVEQRMGKLSGIGRSDLMLIDLPGIYSLNSYSEDARVAVDVLHGSMPGTPAPDAVLLVLDSMHLSRQLMLAGPVLELGLPTLILLNMSDVMEARSGEVDSLALAQELGAPVAKISAARGTGLDAVGNFLARKNAEMQRPLAAANHGQRRSAIGNGRPASARAPSTRRRSPRRRRESSIEYCSASDLGTAALSGGGDHSVSGCFYARPATQRRFSGASGWSRSASRGDASGGLDAVAVD